MDEKAHKESRSTKGAAGTCCCAICANIFNGSIEACEGDEYIYHYKTATPDVFDKKTDERAWEIVEDL
eukprot:8855934-Pyramimonas_sp.AAC.1